MSGGNYTAFQGDSYTGLGFDLKRPQ
jgi:hypothetical protein